MRGLLGRTWNIIVRTRVIPRQELGKEGVVVRQGLASGSRVGRGLASSRKVGQLGCGSLVLIRDLLGNGTCGKRKQC